MYLWPGWVLTAVQALLRLQGAGPTLVVVRGLLVVVTSLVAEHVGSVIGAPDSRAHAQ